MMPAAEDRGGAGVGARPGRTGLYRAGSRTEAADGRGPFGGDPELAESPLLGAKVIKMQPAAVPLPRAAGAAKPRPPADGCRLLPRVTPRLRGLVLLNLVMLACASTFVVLKESQAGVDPFVFSALRFAIAALFFAPFWRRAARDERLVRGGLEVGVWAAGGYLTQSVSMVTAEASRGAFLSGFTVVVVPLLASLCGPERRPVRRSTWASVAASLVGIALLEDSGAPPAWGDFWSLASAVLFGVQIYRTEHWSRVVGRGGALPMMSVALAMCAALGCLSALLAFPAEALALAQSPAALDAALRSAELPWGAILYMGLFVTALGLWAEVIALTDVSSVEAAIIYTMEPVAGAALAYALLGERWGPSGWAGAALIVGACLATQLLGSEGAPH